MSLYSRLTINCSTDLAVNTLEWLDNNDHQLTNTTASVAVLEIESITTEHHNLVYICRAISPFGNQTKLVTIRVAEEVSSVPVAGIAGGLAAALIITVLVIVIIIIVLFAVKRYLNTNGHGNVLTTL